MKLSYEWLKEYVDINVSPEKLAQALTMSGSEVEAVHDIDGDKIMDLEITSNRPDCLSIIGLAREVSTIFDKALRMPNMRISLSKAKKSNVNIKCIIKNKKLCSYYTARIITNVNVKDSQGETRRRISSFGLRPVNNIVDITNFCLFETGQPLHAFDLGKIKGNKIIIREAVKGEKILTIDGIERQLEEGMLVIADSERPIAIAGIMGGKGTEVGLDTKNILLESAYFEGASIRKTARRLGLSSDSSYRFERGVDKLMVARASDRASILIAAEADGKIGKFSYVGSCILPKVEVRFNIKSCENLLGVSMAKKRIKNIFKRLGIKILKESGGNLRLRIPSFREDLENEIDLVEEVARIYGYDKVPETMSELIPETRIKEYSRMVAEKLRKVLSSVGLNEIMTYSLISSSCAERFSSISEEKFVALKNPLSEEQKMLTPQLLDGMLKAISWNINRKNTDLAFFEIGTTYSYSNVKNNFQEKPALCIALTGCLRKNWKEGERLTTFYDLKGIIEVVFNRLKFWGHASCKWGLSPTRLLNLQQGDCLQGSMPSEYIFKNYTEIKLASGGDAIGFLGEVSPKILAKYDIPQTVYISQIKLGPVYNNAILTGHYHPIPRFPSSSRDVSILCDKLLFAEDIYKIILETEPVVIRNIDLVDAYEGEQIPSGKRSLSYSIKYGRDDRTLTDEEIEKAHSRVKSHLVEKLGVSFR